MIALGKLLGRCKIFGISLGVTWILFVGIIFSYFGFNLDPSLLHFIKELGLIFFVYSRGMQVGPRFKVVTYTTSANLMIREIGISLFLAWLLLLML